MNWDIGAIEAMVAPPPPPPPPITLPTITFVTPNNAGFASNDVTVRVAPRGAVRVELFRNDHVLPIVGVAAEDSGLPAVTYLRWQAVTIPRATYMLTAYAYDAAGNKSLPATVTVIRR